MLAPKDPEYPGRIAKEERTRQKFLLVSGCPRSGTTELVKFLNQHNSIALGCERYLYRFSSGVGSFGPELFLPERFGSLQSGDTFWESLDEMPGWAHSAGAVPVKEKFGSAAIVGDKIPDQVFKLESTLPIFLPDARAIICVRDLLSVIRSWQIRADNIDDHLWSRTEGAEAGLRQWAGAMAILMEYEAKGLPVKDVFMPNLYKTDRRELTRLLDFLDLEADAPTERAFISAVIWRLDIVSHRPDDGKSPTEFERELVLQHPYIKTTVEKLVIARYRINLDLLFWDGFSAEFDKRR